MQPFPRINGNSSACFAGIDLGSNSFRLLIAQVESGMITLLHKRLDPVRLGRGLASTGALGPEAMTRAFQVLAAYREALLDFRPATVRACGTAALRRAGNRDFFLQQASGLLEVEIEVIDGDEEALLCLRGAASRLPPDLAGAPVLLVDVGGGSTELIYSFALGSRDRLTASLPLGAVPLTEAYLHQALPTDAELAALVDHIESLLFPFMKKLYENPGRRCQPPVLVATGGTATALAALDLELTAYDETRVHGHVLSQTAIDTLISRLRENPPATRNNLPGLEQGRGEIVLAGALVLRTVLSMGAAPQVRVSDAGLLDGILLSAAGCRKNVFTKRQKSHIS